MPLATRAVRSVKFNLKKIFLGSTQSSGSSQSQMKCFIMQKGKRNKPKQSKETALYNNSRESQ